MSFAHSIGDGVPIQLSGDGWSLGFGLDEARRGVTAERVDDVVLYADVAPGTDLEYRVVQDALKEEIVLHRPPEVAEDTVRYRFAFVTEGLTAEERAGTVSFVDAAGETVARIPQGVMYDSRVGQPAKRKLDLALVEDDGETFIDVIADAGWLNSPKRVYPVRLDPTIESGSAPPQPVAAYPLGASVRTIKPTLVVYPVTDPEGDPVSYWFRVSTGTGSTGQVIDSGWKSTYTWETPPLEDGQTYNWIVFVTDGTSTIQSTWTQSFTVDLRLGTGDSDDSVGLASVQIASGNMTVGTGSPSFPTVGGSIGVSFTYDSFVKGTGLLGEYSHDVNNNKLFDDNGARARRVDPQINFDFQGLAPLSSLPSDHFLARWTGTVAVPNSGSWQFGANFDDAIKIWVNDQLVLDRWAGPASPSTPVYQNSVSLTAGAVVPIKIEFTDVTGWSNVSLKVRGPGVTNDTVVPSDWLAPADQVVPPKWSFSAGMGSLKYSSARINTSSVTLVGPTNETYEYRRNGTLFIPPDKDDSLITTDANTGNLVVHSSDGMVYAFRADGGLDSARSGADSRNPASPSYVWTGDPARVTAIVDPVSQRQVSITYGGGSCPTPPSGFAATPVGMVCRVSYWDGTETHVFYLNGQLARIVDPGNVVTDFGYTNGRITRIRDPLAVDAVAAGVRADDDTTRTIVTYDETNLRVGSIDLPLPAATTPPSQRPRRTYSYNFPALTNGFGDLDIAGTTGTSTFDRRVLVDPDTGLVLKDTALDGTWREFEYDESERVLSVTDSAGRKSTTLYDQWDRPTDQYGPAPSSLSAPTAVRRAAISLRFRTHRRASTRVTRASPRRTGTTRTSPGRRSAGRRESETRRGR